MAGSRSFTSPGRPTSPSGGRAGKALPAATTSAPGDRTAHTPQAVHGLLGMNTPFTPLYTDCSLTIVDIIYKGHRKRSIRRSGTRLSRMDTISAGTGLSIAHWRVAIGREVTFGGAPRSSGALGFSSPEARVRGFRFCPQQFCFL